MTDRAQLISLADKEDLDGFLGFMKDVSYKFEMTALFSWSPMGLSASAICSWSENIAVQRATGIF